MSSNKERLIVLLDYFIVIVLAILTAFFLFHLKARNKAIFLEKNQATDKISLYARVHSKIVNSASRLRHCTLVSPANEAPGQVEVERIKISSGSTYEPETNTISKGK